MPVKINLNGQWNFIADLDPKYHEDISIHAQHEYLRPDANRRFWHKVPVPGVWQKYGERYDIYEGVCWFSREFNIPYQPANARLRFGGVNYLCDVYINGKHIGSHEGGYTEFTLDTRDALHEGENHIAVRVDNRATNIKWPPCLGYFNYGGIHRDVTLELDPIPDIYLSAEPLKTGWRLRVTAEDTNNLTVSCHGQTASGTVIDILDVKSWSPDSPQLYPVRITFADGNETEILYGFKTVEVRDGVPLLNDKPISLNGVCYVYDSPVNGLVMKREELEKDLHLIKEMGAVAVRCHYPMDKLFYEICDRIGLLVWIEPPVYCYHPGDTDTGTKFADKEWLALAENMIIEMIRSAKNHPCVAIYGIGNECNTKNAESELFFKTLAAAVRREDSARLVSYAALYGIVGPIADIVDVLGVNSYWGWYDKVFGGKGLSPEIAGQMKTVEREPIDLTPMRDMLDTIIRESRSNLALLLTEFGADSVPGFYATGRDLWSENYHAELLTEIFALGDEYPQIVGTFPFCFTDYRDPSKFLNGYWDERNLKGLVSYNRERKLAYEAVKKRYGRKEKK